MEQEFKKIWYASERRIKSPWKFLVFNDRGFLRVSPTTVTFQGKKQSVAMEVPQIQDISLAHQSVNWGTYSVMDLLASLYIFFAFPSVVWEDLFIALLIGNLLGLAINRTTKWIRVEYTDAGEKKQLAYFADGSLL